MKRKVIAPLGNFKLRVLTTNLESFMRRNQKIIVTFSLENIVQNGKIFIEQF